jgi:CubicO group peptidase (beta-lactamase class C family)
MVLTTPPLTPDGRNLGETITIRMLVNCTSGMGYSFWGLGNTRNIFVNSFAGTESGQNFIAWLQNIENSALPYDHTYTSSYVNYKDVTETDALIHRIKDYPLLYEPGTTNVYDNGISWAAAVVGKALQLKGVDQTAAQYCQTRIFTPMGITNSWLDCGSLNPPDDVLKKLTNAFFVRQDYSNGYDDAESRGPLVDNGIIYKVFDPVTEGDGGIPLRATICRNPSGSTAAGRVDYTDYTVRLCEFQQNGEVRLCQP